LLSFAMVTVAANTLISSVTDRMPAIIQPEDWGGWLGEQEASVDVLKAMLQPFEGEWDIARQGKPAKTGKPKPEEPPTLF